jgi:hypothetical protein
LRLLENTGESPCCVFELGFCSRDPPILNRDLNLHNSPPRPTRTSATEQSQSCHLILSRGRQQYRIADQRIGQIESCSRDSRQFGKENEAVFAGLTGKGLSYLSASETAAFISAPSCL